MIRITKNEGAGREVLFRVEGTLDAEGVDEFRIYIASSRASMPFSVDVSGVVSIMPEGRLFLAGLRESGCTLNGGSMYINRLLGIEQTGRGVK